MTQDAASNQAMKSTLTSRASAGFMWSLGQTAATKIAGMVGQVILFALLAPGDFGLVAITILVVSFAGILQQLGTRDVLVHRQAQFGELASAGFWLSLVTGIFAAGCVLVAAPIAAKVYDDQRLIGLIAVAASAMPLDALATVAAAKMQIDLRFKALALVGTVTTLLTTASSLLLAWAGAGPYSFVLNRPFVSLVALILYWWLSPVKIHRRVDLRLWRDMLGDSGIILATAFFSMLVNNGDYMVLGLFADKDTLGIYFFAFGLSIQTLSLITANINTVLFPTFSKLQGNPERQHAGFVSAIQLAGAVGTPLVLLQAVAAGFILPLLYHDKAAVLTPTVQILSVSMAFAIASGLATPLIRGQGRFMFNLAWTCIVAVFFLTCVAVGARSGSAIITAWAVFFFNVAANPFPLALAVAGTPGSVRKVLVAYSIPIVTALAAFGAAWLLATYAMNIGGNSTIGGIGIALAGTLLYIAGLRLGFPRFWQGLRDTTSRIHFLQILLRRRQGA